MNRMNMPGFTGEESLYRSRAQYNTTATGFLASKAEIRPQLSKECSDIGNHLAKLWQGLEGAYRARNWHLVDVYAGSIRAFTNLYSECR
jgi:hypothetical protein